MYQKNFFVLICLLLVACSKDRSYRPSVPVYDRTQITRPSRVIKKPPQLDKSVSPDALNTDTHTPPIVISLLLDANKNSQAGNLKDAVFMIERALRIDARNPLLIYTLATLRLKQSKPRLAKHLAKKAALLATQDKALTQKIRLLINKIKRQQDN